MTVPIARRKEYQRTDLDEGSVDPDPFRQFAIWFQEAEAAQIAAPNAMALATADASGRPTVRTVLLKGFDRQGFVWYSNYGSRKGQGLLANPYAALLFYWQELGRQVRLEGIVERVSRQESELYFRSRPIGSQIGALVSRQSTVISSRAALEAEFAALDIEYADGVVPLPDDWGGFRLFPDCFELWQSRPNRLHDRLRYVPDGDHWRIERLAP